MLLALFALHRLTVFPDLRFVGTIWRRDVYFGIAAITLIYAAATIYAISVGQPREIVMVTLYNAKTTTQNAIMVASLLVLPPIVEEVAFRHFLLSTLPYKLGRSVSIVAVVATAAFFAYEHPGYQYLSTDLLLFAVGCVLAVARIRSDGMVLPMALHSLAIAPRLGNRPALGPSAQLKRGRKRAS